MVDEGTEQEEKPFDLDKMKDEDCQRIHDVVQKRLGYDLRIEDCRGIWYEWSERMAAGWLNMDHENEEEIIHAFVDCGPLYELEGMLMQIEGMDPKFRLMLLCKVDDRYCRRCGARMCILCQCRMTAEDKDEPEASDVEVPAE